MTAAPKRRGFAVIELIAIFTILGIIAFIVVPRLTVSDEMAKEKQSAHEKAVINAAVERFYVKTGEWPAEDLSDIGVNAEYFPAGLPINPIGGTAYKLDSKTHRVE